MRYAYRLTEHATKRMRQRKINPWDALRALERKAYYRTDGIVHYYDPSSGVRVVVNHNGNTIVTMYKTRPMQEARP